MHLKFVSKTATKIEATYTKILSKVNKMRISYVFNNDGIELNYLRNHILLAQLLNYIVNQSEINLPTRSSFASILERMHEV